MFDTCVWSSEAFELTRNKITLPKYHRNNSFILLASFTRTEITAVETQFKHCTFRKKQKIY